MTATLASTDTAVVSTAVFDGVVKTPAVACTKVVDDVTVSIDYVNADDTPVTDAEIRAYIQRGNMSHLNTVVTGLSLVVDGMDIEITYDLAPVPFDRIRRITGYLVGTMDRWNDAKTSEETDRVKHSVVYSSK